MLRDEALRLINLVLDESSAESKLPTDLPMLLKLCWERALAEVKAESKAREKAAKEERMAEEKAAKEERRAAKEAADAEAAAIRAAKAEEAAVLEAAKREATRAIAERKSRVLEAASDRPQSFRPASESSASIASAISNNRLDRAASRASRASGGNDALAKSRVDYTSYETAAATRTKSTAEPTQVELDAMLWSELCPSEQDEHVAAAQQQMWQGTASTVMEKDAVCSFTADCLAADEDSIVSIG